MPIHIVTTSVSLDELRRMAREQFGDFVKAVVDVGRGVMAVGGELHADEEAHRSRGVGAFERALELLDLALADSRRRGRRREIARARAPARRRGRNHETKGVIPWRLES